MNFALLLASFVAFAYGQDLPTIYEYYTGNGVTEGLKAPRSGFTLNNLPITIYSGSIHYFRVHPDYWRDRLRKARAAGLNAVDTYVPWNLHEPRMGEFDYGDGNDDFSLLLDVRRFIEMAKEEDLFVILRPGPYICSEWEFGGLPSWLLRYEGIKVRTSDTVFTSHVRQYLDDLLPRVADLTFLNGGPIIALQVENEYGHFGLPSEPRDTQYLEFVRDLFISHGLNELYFTSDSPGISGDIGAIPGELQTANFDVDAAKEFDILLELQPDKALLAMEYWTGWFDHWMEPRHSQGNTPQEFADILSTIFSYNASVNFYMFHGGTSFGFLNGANNIPIFPEYAPDVSSYDYDAPLSEAGDYTEKYRFAKELIASDNQILTYIPDEPEESVKTAYPAVDVNQFIPIFDLFEQVPAEDRASVSAINANSSMENLPVNGGSGQSYGYVAYRKVVQPADTTATLKVTGFVNDIALVLVGGDQLTAPPNGILGLNQFGFWPARDAELAITDLVPGQQHSLDIIVENCGRNNFGRPATFEQKKGLWTGPVLLDGTELVDWEVLALQFKGSWVQSLTGWQAVEGSVKGPAIFRTTLTLTEAPTDTFMDMSAWGKGCIFINGFPLGRYFSQGPQLTSYIPAPLLKQGDNEIVIFEHYAPASQIIFTDIPNLGHPENGLKKP